MGCCATDTRMCTCLCAPSLKLQQQAATKIQARFRGFQVRKKANPKNIRQVNKKNPHYPLFCMLVNMPQLKDKVKEMAKRLGEFDFKKYP